MKKKLALIFAAFAISAFAAMPAAMADDVNLCDEDVETDCYQGVDDEGNGVDFCAVWVGPAQLCINLPSLPQG